MKRYIAFLRGINISGKNKISMAELKKGFEELGFQEVKTYLNSGNVIFSSEKDDTGSLINQIEAMIKNKFDLDIPVFALSHRGKRAAPHAVIKRSHRERMLPGVSNPFQRVGERQDAEPMLRHIVFR